MNLRNDCGVKGHFEKENGVSTIFCFQWNIGQKACKIKYRNSILSMDEHKETVRDDRSFLKEKKITNDWGGQMTKKKSIFYAQLEELADEEYQQFQAKLTPNLPPETIMGVRIPKVRALAKALMKEQPEQVEEFLQDLPHGYYDENNLHGVIISQKKDVEETIHLLNQFLPYVDNWATCDIMHPRSFSRHKGELLPWIFQCLSSEHEYTVRFGIGILLYDYLDEDFKVDYLERVANVSHRAYYVKMMVAWYFATALTKQYEAALPFLEEERLDVWTHNKAIQKARESRRISEERKSHLKGLKRKN